MDLVIILVLVNSTNEVEVGADALLQPNADSNRLNNIFNDVMMLTIKFLCITMYSLRKIVTFRPP